MRTCVVEGCERPVRAKGMCLMHYKRDRYSPYGLAGRPPKPKCEHCDVTAIARGLCPKHWKQWQKWGDPLHADRARAAKGDTRVNKGYAFEVGSLTPQHRALLGAKPGEVVHHIDGNKLNNAPSNLVLLADQAEHGRVHRSLHDLSHRLVRDGVIAFNRDSLAYELADDSSS